MKIIKLTYPAALAAAIALSGAGCKHGSPGMTPLPALNPPPVANTDTPPQPGPGAQPPFNPGSQPHEGTLPPVPPVNLGSTMTTTTTYPLPPGPIGEGTNVYDLENYLPDRTALESSTVHFQFDSAVVLVSEQENVKTVMTYLSGHPTDMLMIEGNCDERGTEEYNRSLGERRALALRESLIRQGINLNRIRTTSFGKDKPVDPAHNETAWAKNRRGDFVVEHPKNGTPPPPPPQ